MEQFYRRPAIRSSFLRTGLFLLVCLLGIGILEVVFSSLALNNVYKGDKATSRSFYLLLSLILVFIFKRFIDRRPWLHWFGLKRLPEIIFGFAIGGVLLAIGTGLLIWLENLQLYRADVVFEQLPRVILFYVVAAAFEEVVVRGYVLSNLMEVNHFIAIVLSSVIFMLMHSYNNSLTFIAFLNLFLAGIVLAISFLFTKNLWFPIGLHIGWNFFQGSVFGFEVSGIPLPTFFLQEELPNNIFTGGDFGFEGSIFATILLVLTAIFIYFVFRPSIRETF